jgi:Ppx/GppA phosphatase family
VRQRARDADRDGRRALGRYRPKLDDTVSALDSVTSCSDQLAGQEITPARSIHASRKTRSTIVRCSRLILLFVLLVSPGIGAARQPQEATCAIDMESNTFRRIVGSFANGQYQRRSIEKRTLSVGDDLAKHGRISDAKLADIDKTLADFKAACGKDGAAAVLAIGTAAFRDAPNGRKVVDIAAARGVVMEIATEAREAELAYLVGSLGRDDSLTRMIS